MLFYMHHKKILLLLIYIFWIDNNIYIIRLFLKILFSCKYYYHKINNKLTEKILKLRIL